MALLIKTRKSNYYCIVVFEQLSMFFIILCVFLPKAIQAAACKRCYDLNAI